MFNKLKATTLAAFSAMALSTTPAFALDVAQFLTPGETDYGIFRESIADEGCQGSELWVTSVSGDQYGRPGEQVAQLFVYIDASDEEYSVIAEVWYDYDAQSNELTDFQEGIAYSSGVGQAFPSSGNPIGQETCPNLIDITPVSVTNTISSEGSFATAGFLGYIFDATDTNDGQRYRFTVGFSGALATQPVWRREAVSPPQSAEPAEPENEVPTANAGPNQTVQSAASVTLNGTGSFTGQGQNEPDQTLNYAWTQTGGPNVNLSSTSAASPAFTAPTLAAGDADLALTFSLIVTDDLGLSSTADSVTITVVAGLPVVLSGGPDAITGTEPFTVIATFAKPVTGFDSLTNDVIATNGSISAITGGPSVYTLTIVPTGSGDVSIFIPAGAGQEIRTDEFVNLNSASNTLLIDNRIVEITQKQIAAFMLGRANNLATNQPGLTRFLMGEGCRNFTTKITQDSSSLDSCLAWGNTWAEISSASSEHSSYTLGTIGAHTFVNPDLLIGGMVQFDYADDPANNASGTGWLVGPYFVAKTPNQPLYFEGRLLYGQTESEITPLGTYTDDFDTKRWLTQLRATGDYMVQDTTLMPLLDFTYTEDQQQTYIDSLGNTIPSQAVDLMQWSIGMDFKTPILIEAGSLELVGGLSGIYSSSSGATAAPEFEDWRGRTHLGLDYAGTHTTFRLGTFYDGLGSDYESYGANLTLDIRF